MSYESASFSEKITSVEQEIDIAVSILQKDFDPRGHDQLIDNAVTIIKKYIVAESTEELTLLTYTKNIREKSIQILEKMKANLATLDENDIDHVKGLDTILNYPGRKIIGSTTPIVVLDSSEDHNESAQRSRFVIDLAFLAAFGDRFDYKRYAEDQLKIKKLSESSIKEFFEIFQKQGAEASISSDTSEIEEAVINYLHKYNLNKKDKISFLKKVKNINEYAHAFLFVQKASNEGFTADLLNNTLANIVLFSTINFDDIIDGIKKGAIY